MFTIEIHKCQRYQCFYGLIIRMYYFDNQQHNKPHIHVHFQDHSAIIEIPTGTILEGEFPKTNKNLSMPG